MKEQTDIFDFIKDTNEYLEMKSSVKEDSITSEISKAFDYKFGGGG